ncbi:uncharacterized protein [Amphiura filiformis]|uniref:uncharacterized protein n=1 Tax=Amphiura filiformis TaxID=82378 RepID=UPI003B214548
MGFLCHLEDACVKKPCHPAMQCFTDPSNGDAICICERGYEGSDCSQDIDECNICTSTVIMAITVGFLVTIVIILAIVMYCKRKNTPEQPLSVYYSVPPPACPDNQLDDQRDRGYEKV